MLFMLTIEEIKDKRIWEDFICRKNIPYYPFFQSWNWGEVQKKLGFNIARRGLFEKSKSKKLVGVCLITNINARRGHFLHLRHGPVLPRFLDSYLDLFISYVKQIARKDRASFLRISPLIEKERAKESFFAGKKFISAPMHNMDAEVCWVLDISIPEDELFKNMRKTHRYLIKKAQSLNIKIIRTKNISKIDSFLDLYRSLSVRKSFVPHTGIREELNIFGKDDQEELFLAYYNDTLISAALVAYVGNMAIYRHSASSELYRNIPASYLIQWEAIKEAKKRGINIYNFWGIAPQNKPRHPWKGLTLFKTGFGGYEKEFIHALDLPLNGWYWKTYGIELFRRWMKGY